MYILSRESQRLRQEEGLELTEPVYCGHGGDASAYRSHGREEESILAADHPGTGQLRCRQIGAK